MNRLGLCRYYLPTIKVKDYNVIIDRKSFFDHPIKNHIKTYDNIRETTTGHRDDYRTVFCWIINISKSIII